MRPWHSRCVIALVAAAGLAIAASVSFAQSPQGQAGQSAADSQGQPTSQRERSSQGSPDSEPPRSTRVTHISEVVRSISECLANDQEAVLFTDSVDCMPYRQGQYHLKPSHSDAPFDFNSEKHCPEESSNRPFNGRRLTAETIKTIAKNTDKKIGPHGIRILRAIFCEKVDLVGLELPFSLVLDKSVFTEGIEIRNIKMRGDLSFDDSFVFKHLNILRSHIDGSIFGDTAFIQDLAVLETTINGSVSFHQSVLFHIARFDGVAIARELSVRGSALSYFMLQFSRITGLLDVSHSEARCAYHINKSEIGFLVAKRSGFGTIAQYTGPVVDQVAWRAWRRTLSPAVSDILKNDDVARVVSDKEGCVLATKKQTAQFYLFDSRVTSSLCISEFEWLAPRGQASDDGVFFAPRNNDADPLTVIAINGNEIGNNLIIDLWSKEKRIHDDVSKRLHKLEAIGVKTGGLVIDFSDSDRRYFTAVDGLNFDRIYDAHAVCEYGINEKTP